MQVSDLVYIDLTGFHYQDYPTFLSYFQGKMQAIYGADIYLEADSQDGQWTAVLAKAIYDTAANDGSTYSSFSPRTAQGTGLSRNVKINGISRQSPTFSTVDLTVIGTAGTILTTAVAIDTIGQKWDLPSPTIIPGGGSIIVTAKAEVAGSLSASASTVNKIFTPTLGWQSVNNTTDASIGQPVETDAELRIRQAQSTANPSLTVFDGTIGAVENVTGVSYTRGYENDGNTTDVNGIPSHSICVVVDGGAVGDICQAIQIHKTPGTGTYGNTSKIVYDTHGMPLLIKFQRPTLATITVQLTLAVTGSWTTDYETSISASISSYINSIGIGGGKAGAVQISKLYPAAYLPAPIGTTYDINLLRIKKNAGSYGTSNIAMAFDELPFSNAAVNVVYIIV